MDRDYEKGIPCFVKKEFDEFLKCGVLAHGFLRVQCTSCKHEKLVAFSCKRRGFCPSCGARRMAESATHLVDEVFPKKPMRQWVLTFPFQLRFLAREPKIMGEVLSLVNRTLSTFLIKKAGLTRKSGARTGSVTFIQRFGGSLNLNIHFHMMFPDGVYSFENGTTRIVLDPLDFLSRLASLVPRPRTNLIRFHGVFAPNFKHRCLITPKTKSPEKQTTKSRNSSSMTWAMRLKRVFGMDIEVCSECGGKLKVISSIEEPEVIEKILTHLGLDSRVPEPHSNDHKIGFTKQKDQKKPEKQGWNISQFREKCLLFFLYPSFCVVEPVEVEGGSVKIMFVVDVSDSNKMVNKGNDLDGSKRANAVNKLVRELEEENKSYQYGLIRFNGGIEVPIHYPDNQFGRFRT